MGGGGHVQNMKGESRNPPNTHSSLICVYLLFICFFFFLLLYKKKVPQVPLLHEGEGGGGFIYFICKERESEVGWGVGREGEGKKSSPSITRDEQLVLIFICINFHTF